MKVCHVTMHYQPLVGGQEVYIKNLIDIFNKHGIQSDVIQPFNFHRGVNSSGVKIIYTPTIPKLPQWLKWFVFNLNLRFYRKKLKYYDVLICHYPFHYPAVKWHKKVIVVSHGILFDKQLKTIFDKYLAKASQLVCRSRCLVVANDTDFLRYNGLALTPAENFFTEVKPRMWFIPNCIDIDKYADQGASRDNKIVVVRNIRPDRGIDLAIRAFALFNKEVGGYQLAFIGSVGDKKYYEQCRLLVSELGLDNQVEFIGHLNQEAVIKQYAAAKMSLVPSLAKEGTSLSALESMAGGTPVVSTDIGGLADLPALKVAVEAESMAKAMLAIINDWQYYSTQQKAEVQKFNLNNWAAAWLKVIKSLSHDY